MEQITVYVPCYNGEQFIEGCLGSLLRQTLKPSRIMLIDDGSTDSSAEIAADFPIEIISHDRNKGLSAARNTAIAECATPWLAAIDVDCVADDKWLENLAGYLEMFDENTVGIGGRLVEGFRKEVGDHWRSVHMVQHWGDDRKVEVPWLYGNNKLFRVDALKAVDGYNPVFRTNYEDLDISSRLKRKGWKLAYTPDAVVTHQRRDTFTSAVYTRWRWTALTADKVPTFGSFGKNFCLNWARGVYFTFQDFMNINLDLIPVDLAYGFLASYYEIRDFFRSRN